MCHLNEVKGKMLNSLAIDIDTNSLTPASVELLKTIFDVPEEKTGTLTINLYDNKLNRHIRLDSKKQVAISKSVVNILDEMKLTYKFY